MIYMNCPPYPNEIFDFISQVLGWFKSVRVFPMAFLSLQSVIQIWTLLESTKHSFITQDKNEYLR